MAITNREIIATEKLARGITEEIHTFARWKSMGYAVKKGEHSNIKFAVWKPVTCKNKETGEEYSKLIMKVSAFFTEKQVEKIAG